MRILGQRAEGILAVHLTGDTAIVVDVPRGTSTPPISLSDVEAMGPWQEPSPVRSSIPTRLRTISLADMRSRLGK